MSDLFPCPGCQRHVRRSEIKGAAGRTGDDATGGGGDGGLTTIYGGPPAGAGGE